MATLEDKMEIKKEIRNYYTTEINVLNNIKKTIEDLEGQIGECTNEIQQVQMSRIELEDKLENNDKNIERLPIKDLKNSSELSTLKKDLKKEIKKLQQSKASIDKYISYTVNKLNRNGLKLQEPDKNRKSIKNYIDRWVYTIQNTYKEIYNA